MSRRHQRRARRAEHQRRPGTLGAHRHPGQLARWRALAAVAVAVGLASAGTGTVWVLRQPAVATVEAGIPPDGPTGSGSSPTAPTTGPAPTPDAVGAVSPGTRRDAVSPGTARDAVSPATPSPPAPPRRLLLPGVAAEVVPVAVDPDRRLRIPDDPRRVGWWVGGAAPGAPAGTVVVAGHVDSATGDRGALYQLHRTAVGTAVTLETATGARRYRVVARHSVPKQRLAAELFTREGPPRLVLITCGGVFRDGYYERNIIVSAVPA